MKLARAALALAAVLTLVASCYPALPAVDRVADGATVRGRYVSHLSYAAYAEAAQLEALGELEAAEKSYQRAMDYDPDSWEIWTRLGAVRCGLKRPDASEAFSRAETLAPEAAGLWLARARCELLLQHPERALKFAERSLRLDPNHAETTRVIGAALDAQGKHEEAERWLVALALRHPGSPAAQLWLASARHRRSEAPAASELVDQAILDDRPELASARALEFGLSEAELAAREVALGLTRQGLERARVVFEADPGNATAWVVLLVATDLLGHEEEYRKLVTTVADDAEPLNELVALLLADLLKRRAGADSAHRWLEATTASHELPKRDDALAERMRTRLVSELTTPERP